MKLGIISDIHSNIAGLRTALDRLAAQKVDRILCAGDLVDVDPNGDEVVALIRVHNIPCVRGNHDQDARAEQATLRKRNLALERHAQIFLSDATLDYVSSLPKRLDLQFDEQRICLAHGAPWSNRDYVWPESDTNLLERVVTEANANIIVLGHTHIPMCLRFKECLILNAGSLDENRRDGRQTYAVLDITTSSVIIYDLNSSKPIRTCGEA
jgi:putative phosphoesterase